MVKLASEKGLADDEMEALALREYESHLGRVILVHYIDAGIAYPDDDDFSNEGARDDQDDVVSCKLLDPPLRCRIKESGDDVILRWNDSDHIDPYWEVEPLEEHRDLPGLRWASVSGHTIGRGGVEPSTEWELLPEPDQWESPLGYY